MLAAIAHLFDLINIAGAGALWAGLQTGVVINKEPGVRGPVGPVKPIEVEEAREAAEAAAAAELAAALPFKQPLIDVTEPKFGADKTGATDTTVELQAALTAANAAKGGRVYMPAGTYKWTKLSMVKFNHVTVFGAGAAAVGMRCTETEGTAIDLTEASFCHWTEMTLLQSNQRVAGRYFYLDNGVGACQRNMFTNLRMGSCFVGIELDDCTTTVIDNIQMLDFNAAWKWVALIWASGTATSTICDRLMGGSAAEVEKGVVHLTGAGVDTFMGSRWDVLNFVGSTGMTALNVEAGEWVRISTCSMEAGTTKPAVRVAGGKGIEVTGSHMLGEDGVLITGGKDVTINGGEILGCAKYGVHFTGGSFVDITGVNISDCSRSEKGTFHGVSVSANLTDWTVIGCSFGNSLLESGEFGSCVSVAAGTSNRYRILGNTYLGFKTSAVADGGTGTDKLVQTNTGLVIGNALTVTGSSNINSTFVNLAAATVLQYSDVSLSRSAAETLLVSKKLKVGTAFGANGKAPVTPVLGAAPTTEAIRLALIEVGIVQ